MQIQICSDLHLEFPQNRGWLQQRPLTPKGDILVVAGDTQYLNKDFTQLDFIQWAADNFEAVYLVPGNHEYYGGYDAATALKSQKTTVMRNVFIVNNYTVEFPDFRLICATMWSSVQQYPEAVERGMSDFYRIKFNGLPLTVKNYNEMHRFAFNYLTREVEKPGKKVVVTHHLPSMRCNAPEFRNSMLNEAFCVDQTRFITEHDIDYWVYGHSHRNLGDFKIGDTLMVTNQLGYVDLREHLQFLPDKVITV